MDKNKKSPWSQDYPAHTFELVSPELPAGSAWLVNCLFELGIPVWNPWEVKIKNEWQRLGPNRYSYIETNGLWQQSLPALQEQRLFDFVGHVNGRASHRWAGTIEHGKKLIFFVRDPRDLLFSQWRRLTNNQEGFDHSFETFVRSNYHHYPIDFMAYVYLFFKLWYLELRNFDYHIVRFEDYKKDPLETLHGVIDFLGMNFSKDELCRAVKSSSFQVVKRKEDELASEGRLERRFNYASQPYEYKQSPDRLFKLGFISEINEINTWLGYELVNKPNTNLSINASDSWKEAMTDCVFGGQCNDIQRQSFHHILTKALQQQNRISRYEQR